MKNIELLYLFASYAMGGILFYINRDGKFLTTSNIASGSRSGRHAFFWGLLISALLFGILMFGWFIPHFSLPYIFKALVTLLIVCQVLTGLIPERGRKLNLAHLVSAFSLGISMFITVAALSSLPTIHMFIRLTDALLAFAMFALLILVIHTPSNRYLRHQQIFFGCWHAAILVTVYFG